MEETRVQAQIIPFAWAVQVAGHHCRLGFEQHEFEMPYASPPLLGQVAKYFRLSATPPIPENAEVTVTAELPEYAKKLCVTVRNFISHRGFYAVHVTRKGESSAATATPAAADVSQTPAQEIVKELEGLSDEQFEELLILVRKLKAGELVSTVPVIEEDEEDEIDRLQRLERERTQLAHAHKRIKELEAEIAMMIAQLKAKP